MPKKKTFKPNRILLFLTLNNAKHGGNLSVFIPDIVILVLTALAIKHELHTHSTYVHSVECLSTLKIFYFLSVCITCHVELWPILSSQFSRKQKIRFRSKMWAKLKLFVCVLLGNFTGTTIKKRQHCYF